MLPGIVGWSHLLDSLKALNTKREGTMQAQMPWAVLHQSQMQSLWSPSWRESPCEWPKEQMLITQQWLMLMKRSINKSRKLQIWLWPPKCMQTYMWLIGWLPRRRIQYSKWWLSGSLTGRCRIWNICWEKTQTPKKGKLSSIKEPFTITTCLLVKWRGFAMNGCHWDAGHQGQQWILCLLHDQFWWPGMATQMQKVISGFKWCIQHEGICAKAPCGPPL